LVLRAFAAAFYRASNDWERPIPLWIDVYTNSTNEQVKGRARRQLERIGVWLDLWGPRPGDLKPNPELLKFLNLPQCPGKIYRPQPFPGFRATYIPLDQIKAVCPNTPPNR